MYIIKNALRNISRAKGRNLLIGLITLVIAIASSIAITIMASANEAEARGKDQLSITATIDLNRQYLMESAQTEGTDVKETLQNYGSLSLEELQNFADSSYVQNFTYSLTSSFAETDSFTAVSNTASQDTNQTTDQNQGQMPGGNSDQIQQNTNTGDFTVIGYSSEDAMTDFIDGTKQVTTGSIFSEDSTNLECVISEELATYNNIGVGSTFTLTSPTDTAETYTFTVTGIYTTSESSTGENAMGFPGSDPANQIYVTYNSLNAITSTSSTLSNEVTGTFAFSNVENFESFQSEVKTKGLADYYTVNSQDLTQFENSLIPLDNLSSFAFVLLLIVLGVGGIVLIVLNMINIRERKYEVGVLTAIGMKKSKVALQFISELFTVTFIAVLVGTGIGALVSNPIANKMLSSQIASETSQTQSVNANFGKPGDTAGSNSSASTNSNSSGKTMTIGMNTQGVNYLSTITTSTSPVIFLQLLGIGLILTVLSSAGSIIIIMRYEPLKILSNRS